MLTPTRSDLSALVDTLKAAAETSRLRILALLSHGDLTVSELTEILNQSQPRVSRHLKLLMEAGLIERYQEGSWAYFRLSDSDAATDFVAGVLGRLNSDDHQVVRDCERLANVKSRRQEKAAEYFAASAASWDQIRTLHVPDDAVEAELKRLIGDRPIQSMLDLGTGTGRLLELFAPIYRRGVGIDFSRDMLAIARANLDRAQIAHAQVRQGDIYSPPVDRNMFDLVTMHQVLHYLYNPAQAIQEAARLLRPGGRFVVVDFAPHKHEFLRDEHAHVRLGFSDVQMTNWFEEAGLEMEETVKFDPKGDVGDGLTVKLWLGRDQRQLIADSIAAAGQQTETV